MIIKFYNDLGTIHFAGGGRDFPFRLTAIEGLGLPGKVLQTETYAGMAGQRTTGVSINARAITMSGDLPVGWDIQRQLSNMMVILNKEGELELNVGYVTRKIKCICSEPVLGERNGAYQRYVFQFICDDPYFEDLMPTYISVFEITPLLTSAFKFRGIFSKRISQGTVNITGSAEVEPVFHIDVRKEGSPTETSGISIRNITTGQYLQLDYRPSADEYITIDIPNRKIYNADGDDLLQYISPGTFLNGMTLAPGENELEVLNYNTSSELVVLCEYTNKYVEAVY